MDLISISTSQNVILSTEKAGVGRRILAILLDYLVEIALTIAFYYLMESLFYSIGHVPLYSALLAVGISMIWFFYHFIFEVFTQGRSLGKMALGIRVVSSTGYEANIYQYFIRALLRPVDMIMGLGLFVMAVSPRAQRLGDIAADTMVIRVPAMVHIGELVAVELEPGYVPLLSRSKIDLLSGKDIELIKRVIIETRKTGSFVLMNKLYEQVIRVLNVKNDILPKDFLVRVVKDYNYYA